MIGFIIASLLACTPNSASWDSVCHGALSLVVDPKGIDGAGILSRVNDDWMQAKIDFHAAVAIRPSDIATEALFVAGKAAAACSGSFDLTEADGVATTVKFKAAKDDSGMQVGRAIATSHNLVAVDYFKDGSLIVANEPGRVISFSNVDKAGCSFTMKALPVDLNDGAWLYEITSVIGAYRTSSGLSPEAIGVWMLPKKIEGCRGSMVGIAGALVDVSSVWAGTVAVFNNGVADDTGRWISHEVGHLLLSTPKHVENSLNLMHAVPSSRTCQINKKQARAARNQTAAWDWQCEAQRAAGRFNAAEPVVEALSVILEVGKLEEPSLAAMYAELAEEAELRYVADLLRFAWNPMTEQDRSCEPDVKARLDVQWARERWRQLSSDSSLNAKVERYVGGLSPAELRDYFRELILPPPPPPAPPPATHSPPQPPPR